MPSAVALIPCREYKTSLIKELLLDGLNSLGGLKSILGPDRRILLKPNMLTNASPEKCVTTHPAIFEAVADLLIDAGYQTGFGDSPGFGHPKSVARKCGLWEAASRRNVPLADFTKGRRVSYSQGVQNKVFTLAEGIFNYDSIISLPKLKTHGMQKYTGCIKNQFGCIPGLEKGEFHVRIPNAHEFARMLVDLNNLVSPKLYIMDGIMAMEGNGPMGGNPFPMNLILMSTDPVAIDATVCRLLNIDPLSVPTIQYGYEAGSGVYAEKDIRIIGPDIDTLIRPEFDINRARLSSGSKTGLMGIASKLLVPKPVIDASRCSRCGRCINVCPVKPKALAWSDRDHHTPPGYHYQRCIRCYCCQELCPEKAIHLKKPLLRKIIKKG